MRFTYSALDRKTVAEIHGNVTEKGERNSLSRVIHARSDKDVVAAWRSDLNRILHVFNVRSVGSVPLPPSLTSPFQTELAMDTHGMVLDIHRNALAGREGTNVQHHSVSATLYPSTTEHSPSSRPNPGQPSRMLITWSLQSHFCTVTLPECLLPRHRGPALDAMS